MAVPAAARASENDTDEGSFWKLDAVLRVACFCAHVVPSLGGSAALAFDVPSLEKRFCSSFICEGVAGGEATPGRGGLGGPSDSEAVGLERPMPKAGTDTPAALRRLMAPWFRDPWLMRGLLEGAGLAAPDETVLPELVLGGRRGGKLGGADLPPPTAAMAD